MNTIRDGRKKLMRREVIVAGRIAVLPTLDRADIHIARTVEERIMRYRQQAAVGEIVFRPFHQGLSDE